MPVQDGPLLEGSGPEKSQHDFIIHCRTKSFVSIGEVATAYAAAGYCVLPLYEPTATGCACGDSECSKVGKHARVPRWQQLSCDPATVARWWQQWPSASIGLRLDDLTVLDIDGPQGADSLAALEPEYGDLFQRARQRSGSGQGWHYFFEGVPGLEKRIKFRPGMDLLTGPGCYVVVAPSLHASGNRYEWADDINPLNFSRDQIILADPPDWLLQLATAKPPVPKPVPPAANRAPLDRILTSAVEKIKAGSGRNDAGLWLFVQMRDNGYDRDEALLVVRDWVARATEAAPGPGRYTQREAEASLRQAYRREPREPWHQGGRDSHLETLLKLAGDFEHYHSGPARDAYVRVQVDDHREVWPADSRRVREILTARFLQDQGRAPSRESLSAATDTILARCGMSAKVDVHVRFARSRDVVYLDLCDERWRAIEVKADGWRVVDNPPVLFRRPSGARALPVPVSGGSLDLLRPLVNAGDDSQWILMVAWLAGAFLPEGAFSHLVIEGEQGSAKTTTARVLHSFLDPSDAGLSAPPADERDATIAAMHSGILGFDNLSGCRADIADVFCRFSTGQGFKTRTLFETLGLTVVSIKIPVMLNGIDSTVMRGDLLERSIILKLPRITQRRTEHSIWDEFARVHPAALGALLDAVSTGLRNLPSVALDDPPRMADFCLWVTSCEPALPWRAGDFIRAYKAKLSDANADLAENDSVASALLDWIQHNTTPGGGITLTMRDLLFGLNEITLGTRDLRHWPSSPEALAHRLVRLAPVLRAQGVQVRKLARRNKARQWQIIWDAPQGYLVPDHVLRDAVEGAGDGLVIGDGS